MLARRGGSDRRVRLAGLRRQLRAGLDLPHRKQGTDQYTPVCPPGLSRRHFALEAGRCRQLLYQDGMHKTGNIRRPEQYLLHSDTSPPPAIQFSRVNDVTEQDAIGHLEPDDRVYLHLHRQKDSDALFRYVDQCSVGRRLAVPHFRDLDSEARRQALIYTMLHE